MHREGNAMRTISQEEIDLIPSTEYFFDNGNLVDESE